MVGRLYHLGRRVAREHARRLLADFDLTDAGGRLVRTYSGGMRRRLDLAAALVARPAVLFLDEPTTGLDVRARIALWEAIEALTAAGTTVLLTTQDLDEADHLADRIAVLENGRVIAEGTSDELKAQVGGDRLEIQLDDPAESAAALTALAAIADGEPSVEGSPCGAAAPPAGRHRRRRPGALTRRASGSSTSASGGRRSTTCS